MRFPLGLAAACLVAAGFAYAYWLSVRPEATWLDGQWIFYVAIPYNWTSLHILGSADFSPDVKMSVAAALLFDVVAAFLVGALVEALLRSIWRLAFRRRRTA